MPPRRARAAGERRRFQRRRPSLQSASEAVLVSFNPRGVPQHRIHHGPELETVAAAAFDLVLQQRREVLVVEQLFSPDRRAVERPQAAFAEVALAKPFLHRRAETLLASIDEILVDVLRGDCLDDAFPHAVAKLVAAWQPPREI